MPVGFLLTPFVLQFMLQGSQAYHELAKRKATRLTLALFSYVIQNIAFKSSSSYL